MYFCILNVEFYRFWSSNSCKIDIVIEFFIDEAGNVRLPVVTDIDGPIELAKSAYLAITSWKFEPPMIYGKPVATRARQPFYFSGNE